ncbi:hypothetical protein B0I35DRAFT_113019 [Stachybotrys elegans]|uniref:Fucose-specific lectin n=1 Tax=Stachybotrys elegans TaxID=80388 RepID=A0A8K0WL19_9HYPO|nr:hypothetical protein B0I35DRAFT_113019 [Stachybotrys elegans]
MSPDASPTAVDVAAYTTLHLAATSFVYPPNAPDIRHCACKSTTIAEATPEQSKHVRVYHTEPSVFAYNQGSYVIRETRFSTERGWHAPSDDLVADDAIFGSPVASIGWWVIGDQGSPKIWQSRVYYIDNTGKLRERTNWSEFTPEVKETFDEPLPDPGSLVPPVPGWTLTPISESAFPAITPLPTSKLAAVKTEDNKIHIFYQAIDGSIEELIWGSGLPNAPWVVGETKVVGAGKAKQGTPLAAITGGWTEVRVFYVGTTDLLSASYTDEHVQWQPVDVPPYSVSPTAMLTAVAWNYASPYFEMRIYSTDDKDELYEISYSRSSGGWAPLLHSVSTPDPGAFSPASRSGVPLSAVAGVIVDDSWVTKVYFHPRRVIGEWDLCTKAATFNGVPKQSEAAAAKRRTEEETRKKIKEEEDRRAEEERARQEAERKAKEEEEARKAEEEARKAKEEEERKANELPNDVVNTRQPHCHRGKLGRKPRNH